MWENKIDNGCDNMRSRTVRPINRREQNRKSSKKSKKRSLGDTMPMHPIRGDVSGRSASFSDTAPMPSARIRKGYEGYQRTIDRRREVIGDFVSCIREKKI